VICDVPLSGGLSPEGQQPGAGSWSREGIIVFPAGELAPLRRVAAAGGAVSALGALDAAAGETQHAMPFFLPDGRHFLFTAYQGIAPMALYAGSLDSAERVKVLDEVAGAQYSDDAIVFVKGTTLMAQPFNAATLAVSGEAVRVSDQGGHRRRR
jgi:hypothetical protein